MRYVIETSPTANLKDLTVYCVDANSWRHALEAVRLARGEAKALSGFSIDLSPDGCRAVDPKTKMRFIVRRANEQTALTHSPEGKPIQGATGVAMPPASTITSAPKIPIVAPAAPAKTGAASIPKVTVPKPAQRAIAYEGGGAVASLSKPVTGAVQTGAVQTGAVQTGAVQTGAVQTGAVQTGAVQTGVRAGAGQTNGVLNNGVVAGAALPVPADLTVPSLPPVDSSTDNVGRALSEPVYRALYKKEQPPSSTTPITYREHAYFLAPPGGEVEAEAVLRKEFTSIRTMFADLKGHYINLAVFDVEFSGKPPSLPIATLSFRDWKSEIPHVQFPRRAKQSAVAPTRMSAELGAIANVAASTKGENPPSVPPPTWSAPPGPNAAPVPVVMPPAPMPRDLGIVPAYSPMAAPLPKNVPIPQELGSGPELPTPLVRPAMTPQHPPQSFASQTSPHQGAVPQTGPQHLGVSPQGGFPSSKVPSVRPPMMDDPFAPILPSQVPALAQAVSPSAAMPANQRVPTGPVSLHDPFAPIIPGSRQEDGVMPLVRPSSAPQAIHPPQQEQLAQAQPIAQAAPASASHQAAAPFVHANVTQPLVQAPVMAPASAIQAPVVADPFAAPRAEQVPPSRPSEAPISSRRSPIRTKGDELLPSLFERVHDLHFLPDAVEAGKFCIELALEKVPSRAGIVHFYDINRREFIVGAAFGRGTEALLAQRHPETEPLLSLAMKKRAPVLINDADKSDMAFLPRFERLGGAKRLLVAPAMISGRFLGAIELMNPLDGEPFSVEEKNALAYLAEQLAEYLGARGIVTDPERILPMPVRGATPLR